MNALRVAERIPVILWRCPACREEETLAAGRVKSGLLATRPVVSCGRCGARWEDLAEEAMTLVAGPPELLGRRTLEQWYELAAGSVAVAPRVDLLTPVMLRKNEHPLKQARSVRLLQEKTRKVRTGGGSYGGVSVPLFRTPAGPVRFHSGLFKMPPSYRTVAEVVEIDSGEMVLTTKRLVFAGRSKPVNLDLAKIIALDLAPGLLLRVHYGQRAHLFAFGPESPLKWLAYIQAACREYVT